MAPSTGSPTSVAAYLRPTPFEIATCWVHGLLPPTALPRTMRTPREALDAAMLPALVDGPCFVSFSGGRDSSAVLAGATALARREGLPDPVPLTRIYPDDPDADESSWQRLVVDHLRLREWVRVEVRGEDDLLGEGARDGLLRRGVLWPPALQVQVTTHRHASGGSLLTGEGGDEVLGSRRVTPLTLLLQERRRPTRSLVGWAVRSTVPRPLRRARLVDDLRSVGIQEWLHPHVLEEHLRRVAADQAAQPLTFDRGTWWLTRLRNWATMKHNQRLVATEHGVRLSDPLLDHGFLAALASSGGPWGWAGRTDAMRLLFADVLPEATLSRTSKARFNTAYSGEGTREFAATWDGTGVDTELVDAEKLRAAWLGDRPTSSAALLLHAAWLAGQQRAAEGTR